MCVFRSSHCVSQRHSEYPNMEKAQGCHGTQRNCFESSGGTLERRIRNLDYRSWSCNESGGRSHDYRRTIHRKWRLAIHAQQESEYAYYYRKGSPHHGRRGGSFIEKYCVWGWSILGWVDRWSLLGIPHTKRQATPGRRGHSKLWTARQPWSISHPFAFLQRLSWYPHCSQHYSTLESTVCSDSWYQPRDSPRKCQLHD